MNKINVLIVSQEQKDYLPNRPEWEIVYTPAAERAIEKLLRQPFDAIVINNKMESIEKKKLKTFACLQQEKIIILSTAGNLPDGLTARLKKALQKRTAERMLRFKIKDNAFKQAKNTIQTE